MSELFHYRGFLQERLGRHGPGSQSFNSHLDFVPPFAVVDLAEIAVAQFSDQLDLVPIDLPFVP